jgi:hypothetical protein
VVHLRILRDLERYVAVVLVDGDRSLMMNQYAVGYTRAHKDKIVPAGPVPYIEPL